MIEVPLNSQPEQLFSIVINEETYDCRVTLNSRSAQWAISIAQGDTDILNGVALAGGIDILEQYNINIRNAYVVNLENTSLDPQRDNLGIVAKLFILTDEEVEEAEDGPSV